MPKDREVESGLGEGSAGARNAQTVEGSNDENEEVDDDHQDHVHSAERDPANESDDGQIVQPKTRPRNRPHVLFENLHKTLGSPLRMLFGIWASALAGTIECWVAPALFIRNINLTCMWRPSFISSYDKPSLS